VLQRLQEQCPLSLAVTLRSLQEGATKDMGAALRREFRIALRFMVRLVTPHTTHPTLAVDWLLREKRLNVVGLIDQSAAVARLCRGRHGAHRGEEAAQLDPQVGRGRAPRRGAGLLRVSSRYVNFLFSLFSLISFIDL
jgi:hypothetical protein